MSEATKKYDIVIFGATGFTGKYVIDEVVRTESEIPNLKWAVAGRKMRTLQEALGKAAERMNRQDLEDIDIIIADTNYYDSLVKMAESAKIVLNCVGPYRFFGEPVVKACVEGRAHHIDISGEPQFLEKMQLHYDAKAKENNVYIIGSCGWDSIPAEMGVIYTRDNFDGDLNAVESFIELNSTEKIVLHFATYQSAIHGFANANELATLRKSLFTTKLPRPSHKLKNRGSYFWSDVLNSYFMPFPGSDRSVVSRSQRLFYEEDSLRPIQFAPYNSLGSTTFGLVKALVFGFVFSFLAKFALGRSLLEKFPKFFTAGTFSHEGPNEKQMKAATFKMTFKGNGYKEKQSVNVDHVDIPDKMITTTVYGPEAGYISTPIAMVQCAYSILLEKDKMPGNGGVLPPGYAFAKTSLIQKLDSHGIKFQVL